MDSRSRKNFRWAVPSARLRFEFVVLWSVLIVNCVLFTYSRHITTEKFLGKILVICGVPTSFVFGQQP